MNFAIADRPLLSIVLFVSVFHLSLLYIAHTWNPKSIPIKRPLEKLIVKTISLREPVVETKRTETVKPETSKPEVETVKPIIEETPKPVLETVKPIKAESTQPVVEPTKQAVTTQKQSKPDEKPKPKPIAKKAAPAQEKPKSKPAKKTEKTAAERQAEALKTKKRKLIEDAKTKISQISKSKTASETSLVASATVPNQIQHLNVDKIVISTNDETLTSGERSYYDELASRLQLALRLPEYGEVNIKLTLEHSGTFLNVTVVNAKSSVNRKYIEQTVPTLKFPAFGDHFDTKSSYTFLISLSNEL